MKLFGQKSRLAKIKEGAGFQNAMPRRGRLVVAIGKLLEDPYNERRTFRGMEEMIASVKAHGILEPLTVTAEGENYRILTGHRRFRAAMAAGLTEMEIIVRDPDDALTRRRKSIISNIQREDVAVIELAEALKILLTDDPEMKTQRQLAAEIGKPEQWVSGMLRIPELPSTILEKLRSSEVVVSSETAMRIARAEPGKLQEELAEAALRGESTRKIRQRIAAHKRFVPAKGEKTERTSHESEVCLRETFENCLATVTGPKGEDGRNSMRTALERLLEKL